MEPSQSHSVKPLFWYQNLRNTVKEKKRKLQTNFSDKYKYIDQNIRKSNSTIYKGSYTVIKWGLF